MTTNYFELPETIPVGYRAFQPGVLDARRVPTASWSEPEPRMAYFVGPASTSDPITVGAQQVIIDAQVGTSWPMHHKDRLDIAGRTYQVEGESQDYRLGPFEFKPGFVTNVRYA